MGTSRLFDLPTPCPEFEAVMDEMVASGEPFGGDDGSWVGALMVGAIDSNAERFVAVRVRRDDGSGGWIDTAGFQPDEMCGGNFPRKFTCCQCVAEFVKTTRTSPIDLTTALKHHHLRLLLLSAPFGRVLRHAHACRHGACD